MLETLRTCRNLLGIIGNCRSSENYQSTGPCYCPTGFAALFRQNLSTKQFPLPSAPFSPPHQSQSAHQIVHQMPCSSLCISLCIRCRASVCASVCASDSHTTFASSRYIEISIQTMEKHSSMKNVVKCSKHIENVVFSVEKRSDGRTVLSLQIRGSFSRENGPMYCV